MSLTVRHRLALRTLLLSVCHSAIAAAQARDTLPGTPRDTIARLPARSIVTTMAPSAGARVGSGVPARVSVIEGGALRRGGALLPDVLDGIAGISTYDDLGSPLKRTVTLRGFTASPVVGLSQGLSVFVDGVRMNEPEAAQVNFDLLPLEHVRRVEVLSGTATLLGRNSLGGAINLVTARGRERPYAALTASRGSFGATAFTATAGGARGAWDWYAGGGREGERGWRQVTGSDRRHLFAQVGHTDAHGGLRLQTFAARANALTAGSLPEALFRSRPDSNLSSGDYEHLRQLHIAAFAWRTFGATAATRLDASIAARDHDAERFNRNQVQDPDVFARSRNRTLTGTVDVSHTGRARGQRIGVRAGVEGALTNVAILLNRDRVKFGETRELTTDVRSPGADVAAWGVGDVALGMATLSGGLRFDHVRAPYRNRLAPEHDTVNVFTRVGMRVGLTIDGRGGTTWHASFGQAFRAPVTLELACADPERPCPLPFALGDDPPLAPVLVDQWEAGGRWVTRRALVSAALFRSDVRNDIALLPAPGDRPGSTIDAYFANLARTRRQGVEVDGRLEVAAHLAAAASWTWTRATYQVTRPLFSIRAEESDGELSEGESMPSNIVLPGDRIPLIPDHLLKGSLTFAAGNWSIAGETRYVGQRWARGDEANETAPLAGYHMLDARIGWRGSRVSATLSAENVLGTHAATFGGYNVDQGASGGPALTRFLTPAAPRRFRLELRWILAGDDDN